MSTPPEINPITTSSFSWGAELSQLEALTNQTVTVTTNNVTDGATLTLTLNSIDYTGTVTSNTTTITIPSADLKALQSETQVQTYTMTANLPLATEVTSSSFTVEKQILTIRTRSPFFIRTPEETDSDLDHFDITIAIVSGDLTSSAPNDFSDTVQISKKPIGTEDSATIDISEIVSSCFSQNINSAGVSDSFRKFQSLWVTVETQAKKLDGTNIGSSTSQTFLAQEGYNTFLEGVNNTTKKNALITSTNIQYKKGDTISIPVNTETVTSVEFYESSATSADFTVNIHDNANNADNKITYATASSSDLSNKDVTHIKVNLATGRETFNVEPIEECKYPVFKCSFLNRWGAYQDVYFFKKSTESLQANRENFNRSIFTTSYSYQDSGTQTVFNTYSTNEHSKKAFNTNGNENLVLNTGFVSESMNETFKELLMSEHVYLTDSSNTFPVNITDSNFIYKTSANDRLINYTMNFEKSFSYINNVR